MREHRRKPRLRAPSLLSGGWLPKKWRLRIPVQLSRENLVLLAVAVATVWMSWALTQEIGLRAQMSAEAAQLRQQNAQLAAQNQTTNEDVRNIRSGGWNEEEARSDGYTRPGEGVYIIASPTPPPAVSVPTPKPTGNPFERFWDWLTGSPPS